MFRFACASFLSATMVSGELHLGPKVPAVIEATQPIPWSSDFSFDEATFASALAGLVTSLTPHVYLFGTAGEGYAISDAQFAAITGVFAREMRKHLGSLDTAAIAVISLSLPTIVERITYAAEIGFSSFQLALPSWQALTDDEVFVFFEYITTRFPELQFWHYNNANAKKVLNATHYGRLSRAFHNFVGVKTCNNEPDWLRAVAHAAPTLQLFPNEEGFAAMKDELGCGLLISTASTNPARAHEFFSADAAHRMTMYNGPISAIAACQVNATGAALIDGAYDKQLSRVLAPGFPGRLLPPYKAATETSYHEFISCTCAHASDWLPEGTCSRQ